MSNEGFRNRFGRSGAGGGWGPDTLSPSHGVHSLQQQFPNIGSVSDGSMFGGESDLPSAAPGTVQEQTTVITPKPQTTIKLEEDQRAENCIILSIENEDHTLGNILQSQLIDNDNLLFSGYKKPHPLEDRIEIKVQGVVGYDCTQAIKESVDRAKEEVNRLQESFNSEYNAKGGKRTRYV